jgi:hypothetical protein
VGVGAVTLAAPVDVAVVPGMAANHFPAIPWPFVCPAAVSLAYVCNGQPLYVTSLAVAPFSMIGTVPRVPVTDDGAVGVPVATTGGHTVRQPPVQAPSVEFCSGRK